MKKALLCPQTYNSLSSGSYSIKLDPDLQVNTKSPLIFSLLLPYLYNPTMVKSMKKGIIKTKLWWLWLLIRQIAQVSGHTCERSSRPHWGGKTRRNYGDRCPGMNKWWKWEEHKTSNHYSFLSDCGFMVTCHFELWPPPHASPWTVS